ncbi:RluA family pseudouridine synthase [Campylobacter majalis]|uniref:RluA family pseudouridine synthase n=1 Tax=Campylobacter majalis TaxID=2790656 RepID=UPI001E40CD22|nr:RluA family pseudouridine synthase [Campylobacter majalis]
MVEFIAENEARLDVAVSEMLKISRNQANVMIKNSLVKVNENLITKPSFKIFINNKICIKPALKQEISNRYEVDFDVDVIYEDDDILVLNKPPHVITHPANSVKQATLVEWLNERGYMLSNLNGDIRAGIVHRLDKQTSGAIIIAKTNIAHAALSKQLSDKSMGRIYLALTDINIKEPCVVNRAIGRNPNNRLKNAVIKGGREAKSAFISLISDSGINLIACKLFTGRTHQIRVHLSSINRHILGDDLYGFKSENDKINRVMLHAYILYFKHPISGKYMQFEADIFDDFKEIVFKKIDKEIFYEKIKSEFVCGSFSDTDSWLQLT